MAMHVQDHIAAGHAVPDFVIPTLLGDLPRWEDTTIAEMVNMIKTQGEGRIVSGDADIPAEYRSDVGDFIEWAARLGDDGEMGRAAG